MAKNSLHATRISSFKYVFIVFLKKYAKIYILTQIWFGESINNLRLKIRVYVLGIFNFKCLLIEFVIPNLSKIFCVPDSFNTNVLNRFLLYKITF